MNRGPKITKPNRANPLVVPPGHGNTGKSVVGSPGMPSFKKVFPGPNMGGRGRLTGGKRK